MVHRTMHFLNTLKAWLTPNQIVASTQHMKLLHLIFYIDLALVITCGTCRIINDNVTAAEVEGAIDFLKNNKSSGIDGIPAELIKCCQSISAVDITLVLNDVIGQRDFPELRTEGLWSSVF